MQNMENEEVFDDATNPFSDDINQEDLQDVPLSSSHVAVNEENNTPSPNNRDNNATTTSDDVVQETNVQDDDSIQDDDIQEKSDNQDKEEEDDKLRLIAEVLELQHTLDDLSQRVDNVKEENAKLKSENQVLGQYIDNLMAASNVFRKSGTSKHVKSPTIKRP
ncbi:Short coiled-coil protein A [Trichoplax sp. H2]|nr:Short coiled-coil protein A [Trichoplax sp. H2]|eukprot:RDD38405.1 Short coiled-coil protein A [Trichoplax sp. H2]